MDFFELDRRGLLLTVEGPEVLNDTVSIGML